MERNPSKYQKQDRQLERLAGQMRDTGVAPDRDLWPDIQAAIQREDKGLPRRRPRVGMVSRWRFAAMAATLALMLAAGWVGIRAIDNGVGLPEMAGEAGLPQNSLAVIDQALDELVLALADDPENRNLSHLVLMVHKTRGNLLRRNSENLVRQ